MRGLAAAACLVLVVACGDGAGTTTTGSSVPSRGMASPAEAVEQLFAAVADPDSLATTPLVPDGELIALVAIENELTAGEIATLVRTGVPGELRESYWRSFGASFEEFAGLALDELEVQEVVEFAIGTHEFATVEVGFPTRIGSAYLVANRDEPGGWHVDLLASLAPALLRPIRGLVTALPEGEDGDTVRALFTDLAPSFRAIAESPVDDHVPESVRREIEVLVRFITPRLGNG